MHYWFSGVSFLAKKSLLDRKNIYIYYLSRYKIPADSERKIVDLLCLIAQKIESKGRAHCRADPRLTPFARYSSGVTDTFPFVWDGPQECHTGENSEGFLGCEQTWAYERPPGAFYLRLQLPVNSSHRNDLGGPLMTQKPARWLKESERQKLLKHQAAPSSRAFMGQLKLNTESCKLVAERQFRRRKRVRVIKSRRA